MWLLKPYFHKDGRDCLKKNKLKIAIHYSTWSYSRDWIEYCRKNGIDFKIVNCNSSDVIEQVKDCDILMWHFHQALFQDSISARQVLYSIQQSGKRVFPDFYTAWHFDGKIGQKYLLEAIGAPHPETWVFYDRKEALEWAYMTEFPKVFKLRNGAGSRNVLLVKSRNKAINLIRKSFSRWVS